nr:uncharacterized protein LOC123286599 [Equus asinus]
MWNSLHKRGHLESGKVINPAVKTSYKISQLGVLRYTRYTRLSRETKRVFLQNILFTGNTKTMSTDPPVNGHQASWACRVLESRQAKTCPQKRSKVKRGSDAEFGRRRNSGRGGEGRGDGGGRGRGRGLRPTPCSRRARASSRADQATTPAQPWSRRRGLCFQHRQQPANLQPSGSPDAPPSQSPQHWTSTLQASWVRADEDSISICAFTTTTTEKREGQIKYQALKASTGHENKWKLSQGLTIRAAC